MIMMMCVLFIYNTYSTFIEIVYMEYIMGNPIFVDCPADTWKKITTAATTGQIWRIGRKPKYLQTYRETGDPAPTERSDGVLAFPLEDIDSEDISSSSPIDVYLYAIEFAGRVRVDV